MSSLRAKVLRRGTIGNFPTRMHCISTVGVVKVETVVVEKMDNKEAMVPLVGTRANTVMQRYT
jgi:hypothetical protein